MPAARPPSPIPASTIASIMANAVGVETTYSRKNRNQITSSDKRMQPVPKLMKSIRHGGQYLAPKRREVCAEEQAQPCSCQFVLSAKRPLQRCNSPKPQPNLCLED